MAKKNIISFICAAEDINSIINVNYDLLVDLSKNFKNVYILNLFKLKLFNKNSKIKKKIKYKIPKNIKILSFKDKNKFYKFCKNDRIICFQNLGKSLEYFSIYRCLKKINSINILVLNLGSFGNTTFIDFKIKYFFKSFYHYYDRSLYYFFRFFTIINFFPRIDYLFHSDKDVIRSIKKGLSNKLDNFFKINKISYFKNVIKVNSKSYDYIEKNKIKNKSKKFIVYIDAPLDHLDRTMREGEVSIDKREKFYENLRNFLRFLSKSTNHKIIICPYPKRKDPKKIFFGFQIAKKRTMELIPSASLVIFTESSAITTAVLLKKKILVIQSELTGDYLLNLSNKYIKYLNLKKVNIDNFNKSRKEISLKKLYTRNQYSNFIKNKLNTDGKIKSSTRIINTLKNKYF
jgi:hypothetical protein